MNFKQNLINIKNDIDFAISNSKNKDIFLKEFLKKQLKTSISNYSLELNLIVKYLLKKSVLNVLKAEATYKGE